MGAKTELHISLCVSYRDSPRTFGISRLLSFASLLKALTLDLALASGFHKNQVYLISFSF